MEDINKLEQERKELNTLINKGVSFEVKDIEFETHKRFFGLVKKRVPFRLNGLNLPLMKP